MIIKQGRRSCTHIQVETVSYNIIYQFVNDPNYIELVFDSYHSLFQQFYGYYPFVYFLQINVK